jgi:hypothetical protein
VLVRTSKDKNNPYVMINKTFLDDRRLSLKGKGLLAYCMSKPDGWQFSVLQLAKVLKEGKDSLYAGFEELIELGYCIRDQIRKDDGTFGNSDYTLFETPRSTECLMADFPDTGFPETDVPDTGLSDTAPYIPVKNDSSNKLKREGDEPPPLPASTTFKRIERAPFVKLADKEHEALVQKYGEAKTLAAYQKLSTWKQNTPKSKWKKVDALSIQNWVMDALLEDELKAKKLAPITSLTTLEQTQEIMNRHKEWFKPIAYKNYLNVVDNYEYVQIRDQRTESKKIYFKDPSFKELVKHEITKRELKL